MHMIWCGDYQEVKTLELIWSAPWYSWIQGLQGLDDLQCFNCPWLGHLFPKLNCELWEYSKQTCMRYAELSIFSGLGLMSLGWGDYVIGSYRNLPIRNSAVCVEEASDPGDKLALCALGSLGFSLHCTLWGGLALCLCSAHDACVEGLVCAVFTEVSRVPRGHLTLLPLFHQGSSSAGSEPEPSFKPVLCLSTPKAPAPNQEKRFVSSTKTLLG